MERMKRILILCVLGIMVLSLGACVKENVSKEAKKNSKETTTKAVQTSTDTASTTKADSTSKASVESSTGPKTEAPTESRTEAHTEAWTEAPTKESDVVKYPYLIKVNRACNCVTVYKKDSSDEYTEPVIAFTCSVGDYVPSNPNSEPTPLGEFSISDKYEWGLMLGNVYGRYACRVVTDILFHSVPYYGRNKDTLETDQYNKLGTDASLGCIRLCVRDSKWIYDNCAPGTTVIIYDDASNPGPLGKPLTIKIPEDSPYAGWDPTDETPENPWNNFSAKIEGAEDKTVVAGVDKSVITEGVKAYDKCGNDITEHMEVVGTVDLNKAGTYTVTYKITDGAHSSDEKSAKITVTKQ